MKQGASVGDLSRSLRFFSTLMHDEETKMSKFWTARGYQWDYDGHTYFVYKDDSMEAWDVIHGRTGQRVGWGRTRATALKSAVAQLEAHGREALEAKIEESIKKHGLSPWGEARWAEVDPNYYKRKAGCV